MNELINIDNGDLKLQVKGASKEELYKLAEREVQGIILNIEEVCQNIQEAQELSKEAIHAKGDMRRFFTFGLAGESATEKRSKLNTKAIMLQNNAITKQQELIQATIKLVMLSSAFSSIMISKLEQVIQEGFKECDGRLIRLDKQGKEILDSVITQAKITQENHKHSKQTNKKIIIISAICSIVAILIIGAILYLLKS